jgi:hypothetical protein
MLSVAEAELAALVTMVQDMICIYKVIKSMGLKVELTMLTEMDNSGARDLINSWSVCGRTTCKCSSYANLKRMG